MVPAPGFVDRLASNEDLFIGVGNPLGANSPPSTGCADGLELRGFIADGEKLRHDAERNASIIHIETRTDDPLPIPSQAMNCLQKVLSEKLHLVDSYYLGVLDEF